MRCRITDTIRFKSLGYSRYDQFMRNRSMYAETAIAQLVFMHKQSKKLFAAIERKALPKILKDIMYIMRKGWADRLSVEDFGGKRYDFSHCHLLAEFGTVISGGKKEVEKDLDRLISTLSFLYHAREFRDEASFMVHNVLSDLTSEPKPLDPSEFPVREKTPVIWVQER